MALRVLTIAGVVWMVLAAGRCSAQSGRCWFVSAQHGSDGADGTTPNTAFRNIPRGIGKLKPGDTLIVMPGVYYHAPLHISNLRATAEKPVWLLAQPRGMATITAAWKEAAQGNVPWTPEGDGIYSTPRSQPSLFGWTKDRRFLFRFMKLEHLKAGEVATSGRGTVKCTRHGLTCENGKIYVRLPGDEDPNGKPVMFSFPSWGETPAESVILVDNSPHLIFDGFRIQGSGTHAIRLRGSPHATVRNCIFEYCRVGAGVHEDSVVEWCEHSFPGFFDFAEETRKLNAGKLVVFPLAKEYHPNNWYEGTVAYGNAGLNDPSPKNVEVRYCFVHQVFDGLVLGSFDDSEAHHNVFLHCYDNCVEMETWTLAGHSRNLRFHHNLLLSCPGGPISHQFCRTDQTLEGPHYVYRNVVCGYDDHGWNPWTVIKSKCHDIKGLYYYHNLFLVESAELYWNEKGWPQQWVKNLAFKNNVFIFTRNMRRPTGPRGSEEHFEAAHNIVVAARSNPAIRAALLRNGGRSVGNLAALLLRNPQNLDFTVMPGSPVIDAGIPITGFNDDARGLPDIGPFEFGEKPGPDWPRPRKTAFNVNPPDCITGKKEPPNVVIFGEEPSAAAAGRKKPPRKKRETRRTAPKTDAFIQYAAEISAARDKALEGKHEEAAASIENIQPEHGKEVLDRIARGLRATGELRKWIIAGVSANRHERVLLKVMGRYSRVTVVAADSRGIRARALGKTSPVPWEGLRPKELLKLSTKYAAHPGGDIPADRRAILNDFAFAYGLQD